ncbi:AraC family transcriptional regulator [Bacillus sp. PS06]|nr:AraC family transcriptional regulator [Bacillus sp. PS06]MBD8069912.1 AraC family transcriptional regulator [Bacillus sp. PS06]
MIESFTGEVAILNSILQPSCSFLNSKLLTLIIKLQQVANQVGYYSTRHFTKLFTEYTGCYPCFFFNLKSIFTEKPLSS